MKVKYLGNTSKRGLQRRVKLVSAAGKLSHFYGNVFQAINTSTDYDENLKMIGRITRSGHKSIIEHDYLNLAICDVTPIVEQILIGFRLTGFTIKSRRYVDFRNAGYYTPVFRDKDGNIHKYNKDLRAKYRKHMRYLFSEYSAMVDANIPNEDARFILPYSFHSNIFMTVNAREFEKITIYLLHSQDSRIQEVHALGEEFLNIAREYIPYIVPHIEKYNSTPLEFDYKDVLNKYRRDFRISDKPSLIEYTFEPDDIILTSAVMGELQCSYDDAVRIIEEEEQNDDFRVKLMDAIVKKPENRELEQVSFTWQIPISLSILTHLTRHRIHSLLVPNFVPLWNFNNYVVPATIKNSNFAERYEKAVHNNKALMEDFLKNGVMEEDLVYFYLGCQMCNVTTTMNGRELMWITRVRACNRAQWQIREIVKHIMKETEKVAPLLSKGLGATCEVYYYCPEGRLSCGRIKDLLGKNT